MPTSAPRVLALIAAYNEADVIAQVIGDLIAQGCSVYLIDHRSTDGTADEAARFLERGLVKIERFPDESGATVDDGERFAWEALLRRKEQLAQKLDYDWFIHSDADELRESPWPGHRLAEAIALVDRLGYNAIDFAVFNFRPTGDAFRKGDDLRAAFPLYEPGAAYDKLQIKAWKKTDAPVDLLCEGGHDATFEGRRVFPIRFILRHYPIRSQAHGERKIFRERKPRVIAHEHDAYAWHVQYDAYREGDALTRDPSTLVRFDLDAARARLMIENRAYEQLRDEVGARVAQLEEELAALRAELAALHASPGKLLSQAARDLLARVKR